MPDAELPRKVRKYVFDYFFENSRAPVLEELMRSFSLDRGEVFAALRELEAAHHILLLPGTQRILMANPFSGITTPFRDRIGGRTYFANCAWDTVSLHVMLGQDAEVDAFCHHCGEPISLKLSDGRMVSGSNPNPLIFLSVPVSKWYDNLINTCSNNMVYFSSKDHQDKWLEAHPGVTGESLTVEVMAKACGTLSKERMNLDYAKPSPANLMSHWKSLGLTGANWEL